MKTNLYLKMNLNNNWLKQKRFRKLEKIVDKKNQNEYYFLYFLFFKNIKFFLINYNFF